MRPGIGPGMWLWDGAGGAGGIHPGTAPGIAPPGPAPPGPVPAGIVPPGGGGWNGGCSKGRGCPNPGGYCGAVWGTYSGGWPGMTGCSWGGVDGGGSPFFGAFSSGSVGGTGW